jgi:hypothetical protein
VSRLRALAVVLALVAGVSGCTAAPVVLSAAVPAGPSAGTAPSAAATPMMMDMGPDGRSNIVMVPTRRRPGPRALARADALRAAVIASVRRHHWLTVADLRKDGWEPAASDPTHWFRRAFLTDGHLFDPDRPEYLVVENGRVIGVMFDPGSMTRRPPEPPGAPYLRWHYHRLPAGTMCVTAPDLTYPAQAGTCRPGDHLTRRSPVMSHVWLYDDAHPFAAMPGMTDPVSTP